LLLDAEQFEKVMRYIHKISGLNASKPKLTQVTYNKTNTMQNQHER